MSEKNIVNEKMISNLSDEQLDELLAYAPKFSEKSLANIEARSLEMINGLNTSGSKSGGMKPKRKIAMRKFFAIVAAAIMLLATTTIVLAVVTEFNLGQVFNSLFNNPSAANIMDVGKTVENSGIEVTLISAYVDGDQIYAMLEMRDLQGSRLSADMRLLFEDFIVRVSTPIVYDEAQGTARMGISRWTSPPSDVGDYVSISLETVLAGFRRLFESIDFPLQEYAVEREMITFAQWEEETAYGRFGSVDIMTNSMEAELPERLLKLDEMAVHLPGINWGVISNIGVYNGLLHIQTRRTEAWDSESNHGSWLLFDSNGMEHWAAFRFMGYTYTEYVFEIDMIGPLAELNLGFSGVSTDDVIIGPWDFYFPITATAERKTLTVELQDSPYFSHIEISISPMTTSITYVSLCDEGDRGVMDGMMRYVRNAGTPFLTMQDGSITELFRGEHIYGPEGGWYRFNTIYFDIAELHSITVLGVEHPIITN